LDVLCLFGDENDASLVAFSGLNANSLLMHSVSAPQSCALYNLVVIYLVVNESGLLTAPISTSPPVRVPNHKPCASGYWSS
jgi:hypothetical protein